MPTIDHHMPARSILVLDPPDQDRHREQLQKAMHVAIDGFLVSEDEEN